MSAIRPGFSPAPAPQPAQPGGRDAQAAFFRAALAQGAAPTTAPAPSAAVFSAIRTATPTRPSEPAPVQPDREPPRILRPGSLLDIRI